MLRAHTSDVLNYFMQFSRSHRKECVLFKNSKSSALTKLPALEGALRQSPRTSVSKIIILLEAIMKC